MSAQPPVRQTSKALGKRAARPRPKLQGAPPPEPDPDADGPDIQARLGRQKGASVIDRIDLSSSVVPESRPEPAGEGRSPAEEVESVPQQVKLRVAPAGQDATDGALEHGDGDGESPTAPEVARSGARRPRGSGTARAAKKAPDAAPGATISVPLVVREWFDREASSYQSTADYLLDLVEPLAQAGKVAEVLAASPLLPKVRAGSASTAKVRMRSSVVTAQKRMRVPVPVKVELEELLGRPEYSLTARLSAVVCAAYQESTGQNPFE